MSIITGDLFLMWPPGAGGNFILSLYTWNSMEKIPVNNSPINIFDAQPFPSVAQIDTLADKDIINEKKVICAHQVNDYYIDNFDFDFYKAWAIVPDDFETWTYMVKLANIKQMADSGNDRNKPLEPKESRMQKYLDKVSKMAQKIDNLQKFNYNEVFVKRTVFPEWESSIKQYHEKNLKLV